MKSLVFVMCVFVSAPVFAKIFIDAYRVDPNGTIYEMYRVESRSDETYAWINGVNSKIPWEMIQKVIVENNSNEVNRNTLVLKDGRVFENVRTSASRLFDEYLATNPVTGERTKQNIRFPPDGSIIEFGSVSGGTRKDSQGNLWPAHYFYSPITGESLGNTPKNKIK